MKARVNEELCIGCGVCESVAPEVFSLENGQLAEVIMNPITAILRQLPFKPRKIAL